MDPDGLSITAYDLHDGRYVEVAHVIGDDVFRTERPFPFEFRPAQLVTDGEWRPGR